MSTQNVKTLANFLAIADTLHDFEGARGTAADHRTTLQVIIPSTNASILKNGVKNITANIATEINKDGLGRLQIASDGNTLTSFEDKIVGYLALKYPDTFATRASKFPRFLSENDISATTSRCILTIDKHRCDYKTYFKSCLMRMYAGDVAIHTDCIQLVFYDETSLGNDKLAEKGLKKFNTIAAYWDMAAKDESNSVPLIVDMSEEGIVIENMYMPPRYEFTAKFVKIEQDNALRITFTTPTGTTTKPLILTMETLQNATLKTSVADLSKYMSQTKDFGTGSKELDAFLFEARALCTDNHVNAWKSLMYNIKRSTDYGQVFMVAVLNNKALVKYAGGIEVKTHNHMLVTFDKLCFMKALMEGAPVMFQNKHSSLYHIHLSRGNNVGASDAEIYKSCLDDLNNLIYPNAPLNTSPTTTKNLIGNLQAATSKLAAPPPQTQPSLTPSSLLSTINNIKDYNKATLNVLNAYGVICSQVIVPKLLADLNAALAANASSTGHASKVLEAVNNVKRIQTINSLLKSPAFQALQSEQPIHPQLLYSLISHEFQLYIGTELESFENMAFMDKTEDKAWETVDTILLGPTFNYSAENAAGVKRRVKSAGTSMTGRQLENHVKQYMEIYDLEIDQVKQTTFFEEFEIPPRTAFPYNALIQFNMGRQSGRDVKAVKTPGMVNSSTIASTESKATILDGLLSAIGNISNHKKNEIPKLRAALQDINHETTLYFNPPEGVKDKVIGKLGTLIKHYNKNPKNPPAKLIAKFDLVLDQYCTFLDEEIAIRQAKVDDIGTKRSPIDSIWKLLKSLRDISTPIKDFGAVKKDLLHIVRRSHVTEYLESILTGLTTLTSTLGDTFKDSATPAQIDYTIVVNLKKQLNAMRAFVQKQQNNKTTKQQNVQPQDVPVPQNAQKQDKEIVNDLVELENEKQELPPLPLPNSSRNVTNSKPGVVGNIKAYLWKWWTWGANVAIQSPAGGASEDYLRSKEARHKRPLDESQTRQKQKARRQTSPTLSDVGVMQSTISSEQPVSPQNVLMSNATSNPSANQDEYYEDEDEDTYIIDSNYVFLGVRKGYDMNTLKTKIDVMADELKKQMPLLTSTIEMYVNSIKGRIAFLESFLQDPSNVSKDPDSANAAMQEGGAAMRSIVASLSNKKQKSSSQHTKDLDAALRKDVKRWVRELGYKR